MSQYQDIAYSLIDTKTWSIDDVRDWADRIIGAAANPAVWLNQLSLASTLDEASTALVQALAERGAMLSDAVTPLSIGLLYSQFERGDLSRANLVTLVGDLLDSSDHAKPSVDHWYRDTSGSEMPPSLVSFLRTCAEDAAAAQARLNDVSLVIADPLFQER